MAQELARSCLWLKTWIHIVQGSGWGCTCPRAPHPAAQWASGLRQDHTGARAREAVWIQDDGSQRVGRPQRDGTAGWCALWVLNDYWV